MSEFWTAMISMGGGVFVSVVALYLLVGPKGLLRVIVEDIAEAMREIVAMAGAIKDEVQRGAVEGAIRTNHLEDMRRAHLLTIRADRRMAAAAGGDTETLRLLDAAEAILDRRE